MAARDVKPKRGFFSRLPPLCTIALIKAWFGGAVFYFVGWGLFISSRDGLDLTVALGLALGLVTDLLVNRSLVFLEREDGEYRKYIFSYSKRFYSLPVNLIYGIVLSFCIAYTYHGANLLIQVWADRPPGTVAIGGEPILYGLLFLGYDLLFVTLKGLIFGRFRKERKE